MDIKQLEDLLWTETEIEKENKTKLHADDNHFEDTFFINNKSLDKTQILDYVNNAEGAIVSKQDRYEAVPVHSHDWIELAYMYSGTCQISFGDNTVTLKKGDCILINSYVPHANSCCNDNDILINFLISRNYLSTNFFNRFSDSSYISKYFIKALQNDQTANDFILFNSSKSRRLPLFIQEYLFEFYNKGVYSKDFLDSFITLIFLELADIYKSIHTESTKSNDIVYILRYIEENYNECTLNSTAEFFHMNPNYLSGFIKKNTGKNFKYLIQEQRLIQAGRLLKNTDISITAIAHEIGYDNMTFFYKIFKEYFHCSPNEYRSTSRLAPTEQRGDNSNLF